MFAQKADSVGFPMVAKLFRAAAKAETVHAHAHLRVLNGVKSTAENLAQAIEGEGFEFQQMYPQFLADAQQEDQPAAAVSFKHALAVEEIHYGLYLQAFSAVKAGSDLPESSICLLGLWQHCPGPTTCPVPGLWCPQGPLLGNSVGRRSFMLNLE